MSFRLVVAVILACAAMAQTTPPAVNAQAFVISGTTVDAVTAQPLAGVNVSIYASDNPEFSRRTTTNANGRFSFAAIPAGKFTMTGSTYGYRAQGYHQHGDYFVGIVVGPGLDSENITFRMTQDARIDGTILGDSTEPVRNANVQLFRRTNENGRTQTRQYSGATSDDRGYYVFGHLPPGTYFVAISARPWYAQYFTNREASPEPDNADRVAEERTNLDVAYPLTFYPSVESSADAAPIVLGPGERFTADVTMHAMPAVHLRVKGSGTQSMPSTGASFGALPRLSQRVFEGTLLPVLSSQSSCSGKQGCEFTGIAPGRYVLEMQSGGGKAGRGWYKEVDLSGVVDLDSAESPALASVSGMITFEGGARPAGRLDIVLINRTTDDMIASEITPKGTFDFADTEILPGTYDLVLNVGRGLQISNITASGAQLAGKTLTVNGGAVQLRVTATRALARINGTVLREDKPFPGAMVVLVPRDPASDLVLFRRDESDSDGTFLLPDVLPGAYTVIALENAWDLDWANPVTLQPHMKDGVPVDISGETRLSIKVPLQRR